jgi:hypothetical protein
MDAAQVLSALSDFVSWLGINPTWQDALKATFLIFFALATLMILGDIYRGEIQNTLHRVRLIQHPAKDAEYKQTFQLPKRMVGPTLDGVYTNIIFHYRYRDHRGRIRTRRLARERAKLKVRATFAPATAVGQEKYHSYTDDERYALAKELPDLEIPNRPVSEIVAMAGSKVDYINALWESRMAKADDIWSKLSRSRFRRFWVRLKAEELYQPEKIGLVVKFHFPIDPYFLLYKHPEPNIRSTAWLTVLTSLFAIFMQLVYTQRPELGLREAQTQREDVRTADQTSAGEVRATRVAATLPPLPN